MGIMLIFISHLVEKWGDAESKSTRTVGIVRRSGEDGVSQMLAPQVPAVSDPVFGQEKVAKLSAKKEPLIDEIR